MNIFKINKIFINFLFLIIFLFNTSCSVYQKKEKIILEDDIFDEENYFTDSFFVKDQNINNLWQSYNNKNYNFDYELIEFIEFDFGFGFSMEKKLTRADAQASSAESHLSLGLANWGSRPWQGVSFLLFVSNSLNLLSNV